MSWHKMQKLSVTCAAGVSARNTNPAVDFYSTPQRKKKRPSTDHNLIEQCAYIDAALSDLDFE
jgi:hypothetical protein